MESEHRRQLRSQIQTIAKIPDHEADEFAAAFSLRRLAEKEFLLHAGDKATLAAFIVSGAVREFFTDADGNEFNKSFGFKGDFTGSYYDLLSGKESIASIQALTGTELLVAPITVVLGFYERSLEWQRVARIMAESLFRRKARREYEFISQSAEERYRDFMERHSDMLPKITQYHLASYLGITPVALSRIRKRVEKDTGLNLG